MIKSSDIIHLWDTKPMNETIFRPITDEELTVFLVQLNKEIFNHHDGEYPNTASYPELRAKWEIKAEVGRKFIKLVRDGSAYAFLDRETGNILKAASWKAPAKHPRGNIRQPWWETALGPYGAVYLR